MPPSSSPSSSPSSPSRTLHHLDDQNNRWEAWWRLFSYSALLSSPSPSTCSLLLIQQVDFGMICYPARCALSFMLGHLHWSSIFYHPDHRETYCSYVLPEQTNQQLTFSWSTSIFTAGQHDWQHTKNTVIIKDIGKYKWQNYCHFHQLVVYYTNTRVGAYNITR